MISRRKLLDYCGAKAIDALELWDGGRTREAWLEAFETVRNAPTVDAQPVRHGRWIEPYPYDIWDCYECSCCKEKFDKITNYCPNCGAKMDAEVER